MLRSRASRREQPLDAGTDAIEAPGDPETETLLGDSVGLAMLIVLDTLSPAERVAFVLHELFAVPFQEIAPIVGRNVTATRKLASRARSRIQGVGFPERETSRHGAIVAAFLAASREGNFAALLTLLDPEVVLTTDEPGPRMGGQPQVVGAEAVGTVLSGGAQGAELALIDGRPGLLWIAAGRPRVAFVFTIQHERIASIDLVADQDRIEQLHLSRLAG